MSRGTRFRYVTKGSAKEMTRAVLKAAKCVVVDTYVWVGKLVCTMSNLSSVQSVSTLACITDFVFGVHVRIEVAHEVATGRLVVPKIHPRQRALLSAVGMADGVRLAARDVLSPLFFQYCSMVHPGMREVPGGPRTTLRPEDFAACTLPSRIVDMAVRKVASNNTLKFLAGGKAQWRGQTRAGSAVPDWEAFSLHTNAGARYTAHDLDRQCRHFILIFGALGGTNTANGGESVGIGCIKKYSARVHFVMKRAFPSRSNPNEADIVKTAMTATTRVKGTALPCQADALWDERSSRLFALLDLAHARDQQTAAAGALGEHAGFRVSEAYMLDRRDVQPNPRGITVSLPKHKGDQDSSSSENQVNHNVRCPLSTYGSGWESRVTMQSALPCANDRCGACLLWYHKMNTPYDINEDGPFFLALPPSAKFSFESTASASIGDDAPRAQFLRRASLYSSFNEDLKALGVQHNRIAGDRGWQMLDLVRLSFHGWRHGAITNAFFLGENELAICINYRVRDAQVMKEYICKKLGILMPGNASANQAGAAAAALRADYQPTLVELIEALRTAVITSMRRD